MMKIYRMLGDIRDSVQKCGYLQGETRVTEGESVLVWHFVHRLSEFAQEDVCVRHSFVRSPGYRLRREVRQERVDSGHRIELPYIMFLPLSFDMTLIKMIVVSSRSDRRQYGHQS